MKVLLLNTPIRFNSWQNLEMPLGIAYIAAELEKRGHQVAIKDYEVEFFSAEQLEKDVGDFNPDIIGISFRSSSYGSAKKIADFIKSIKPDIYIVLGGHHASAFSKETLMDIPADFVVRGEGEYVMRDLVEAISKKGDFTKIPGLTHRFNGQIIDNPPAENMPDLDSISFPAWHLLKIDKYVTGSILTSRGCPFDCIYCDKGVSTRRVRFRSIESIYNEIATFEKRYKKGRIYFIDDYFFLHKERLKSLFTLILKNNEVKIRWYCQARVDGVKDIELLKQAKKCGCEMIIYGVETGDEEELKYINKKSGLAQAEEAIENTRRAGIKARANFMIGFPVSTVKTVSNSIRFAKKLNADLYRFFVVSPLPNTVLWDRVIAEHPEIAKVSWDKFDFYSASFDTKGIKKEDLVKYVLAGYFYVLKNRVLLELTIGLIPRLFKLLFLFIKTQRVRGNLSKAFPSSINLFLEEWFIMRHIPPKGRLAYLKEMLAIAGKF